MIVQSIGDVPMRCRLCGHECTMKETEPDCDGDGSRGCPVADCGGVMRALEHDNLLGHCAAES